MMICEKALEFFRRNVCEENCKDCDINNNCDFQTNIIKNYKILKDLVEKDKPKVADIYTDTRHGKQIDVYVCPRCGSYLCDCDDIENTWEYCPSCGQSIDWEVLE